MGRQKQLIVPLEESVVESLQTGDQVQFSGVNWTACDMANPCLCAPVARRNPLLARFFTRVEVITYGR